MCSGLPETHNTVSMLMCSWFGNLRYTAVQGCKVSTHVDLGIAFHRDGPAAPVSKIGLATRQPFYSLLALLPSPVARPPSSRSPPFRPSQVLPMSCGSPVFAGRCHKSVPLTGNTCQAMSCMSSSTPRQSGPCSCRMFRRTM